MRSSWLVGLGLLGLVIGGCSAASEGSVDDEVYGANPFLADPTNGGKADTAYMNPDGREVEVDLEEMFIRVTGRARNNSASGGGR